MKTLGKKLPYIFVLVSLWASFRFYQTYGFTDMGMAHITAELARISFSIFLLTYIVGPWYRLSKNDVNTWLLRNRCYLGISFALVHIIHGISVGVLISHVGVAHISWVTLIAGALGFIVVFVLLFTSTNSAQKRLGKTWHRLHLYGMHYIWFVFTYTLVVKAIEHPAFISTALMPIFAFIFRMYVLKKQR